MGTVPAAVSMQRTTCTKPERGINREETLTPSCEAKKPAPTWRVTKLHRACMGKSSGGAPLQPCFQACPRLLPVRVSWDVQSLVWPRITSVVCLSHSPWTSGKNSLPGGWCSLRQGFRKRGISMFGDLQTQAIWSQNLPIWGGVCWELGMGWRATEPPVVLPPRAQEHGAI